MKPGLAPACLVLLAAAPLQAQTLRGRIVEEGSASPVAGAFVVLEDSAGARVAQSPSTSSGRFLLEAHRAGRFRLRVLRIGYAPWEGAVALARGEVLDREYVLDMAPVVLPEVAIAGTERCGGRSRLDTLSAALWLQAGTALALTNATVRSRAYRFETILEERDVDPSGRLSAARREPEVVVNRWPVQSPPADSLLTSGFVQNLEDIVVGPTWFGPDPDFLLSDAFFDSHCFRAVPPRPEDPPGLIGLAFAPEAADRRVDIRGTLWLDRQSAQLRRLEFAYTRVPSWARQAPAGGSLRFASLPAGGWIVQRWLLRVPVPQVEIGIRHAKLLGFRESEGHVASVLEADGRLVESFPD